MSELETYKIDLKGMKEDQMALEYDLDDQFFASLEGAQLEHGALHVSVSIRKTAGLFELLLHTVGTVTVICDLCLEPAVGEARCRDGHGERRTHHSVGGQRCSRPGLVHL